MRNCVVEGATSNGLTGVVQFGQGVVTGNDNNTVIGNKIRDLSGTEFIPRYLVFSAGSSDVVSNSANTLSDNEVFNFTAIGVYIHSGSDSWNISGNTIYQTAARRNSMHGIFFTGLGTNTIRGNTVRDLTPSFSAVGISLYGNTGNTSVTGNRVWNIGNTADNTSQAIGIQLRPGAGQSVEVVNNMVAISSLGATRQNLYGIYDGGSVGSTTVTAYNTVLISGTGSSLAGSNDTWAFDYNGNSTATVKNNVFLNLRTGGGNHFAANRLPSSTGLVTMDYNVFSGTGLTTAANFFDASDGGLNTGTPISYSQWQANVPSDTHSSAGNPWASGIVCELFKLRKGIEWPDCRRGGIQWNPDCGRFPICRLERH